MSFELIIILIICIPTFLIFIVHNFTKKHSNIFSNIINKIWDEYFEDQYKAIICGVVFLSVLMLIGYLIGIGFNNN